MLGPGKIIGSLVFLPLVVENWVKLCDEAHFFTYGTLHYLYFTNPSIHYIYQLFRVDIKTHRHRESYVLVLVFVLVLTVVLIAQSKMSLF